MLALPVETPGHVQDFVLIVLTDENLARMKAHDPAEVVLRDIKAVLHRPTVIICWEEDQETVLDMVRQGKSMGEIGRHLSRGWAYRPEAGDDKPPEVVGKADVDFKATKTEET